MEQFGEYGYLGVFCALIASGLGFPIPEELPVLTAGVLVGHANTAAPGTDLDPNRLRWWFMLPVCILGVVVSDGFLYGIGRLWGRRLLDNSWVQRRLVTPAQRARIEKEFDERGIMILLTARLTPGIRTPIFLSAGMLRVPLTRFLLADGLYAIPGVNILFWLSYFLTDQVLDAFHYAERYRALIVFGILSAVLGVILYRLVSNRQAVTGAKEEVPLPLKPVEKVTEAVELAVEKAIGKTIEAVVHRGATSTPPPEPSANGVQLPQPMTDQNPVP